MALRMPAPLRVLIATVLATLFAPVLAGAPAGAVEITGPAHVLDANAVEIGGRPIQLYGIDAPPENQICERAGAPWRCGQDASWALAEKLERHWLLCDTLPGGSAEVSRAICYLGGRDGVDIGGWLVEQGWALADRAGTDYLAQEQSAQRAGRGLWAGKFDPPTDWRTRQ